MAEAFLPGRIKPDKGNQDSLVSFPDSLPKVAGCHADHTVRVQKFNRMERGPLCGEMIPANRLRLSRLEECKMGPAVNEKSFRKSCLIGVAIVMALATMVGAPAMALTNHIIFAVNGDTTATSLTQGDGFAWGANCAVGATVVWEIWYDVNNNSAIDDPGDILVASFANADGNTNSNDGPPDIDPTPDGFYMTPEMTLGIAPGRYVFRATDQSDASTATKTTLCNVLSSPPNQFTGKIMVAGHPAPDAILQWVWVEANDDFGTIWSALTDASGNFTINVGAVGTGHEFRIEAKSIPGFVTPAQQTDTANGVVNLSDFVYGAPTDSVYGTVRDENGDPLPFEVWVNASKQGTGQYKDVQTTGGNYVLYFTSDERGEWWINLSQDNLIPSYVAPNNFTIDNTSTHSFVRNFVCRTADTVLYAKVTENGGQPTHRYKLMAQQSADNSFTFAVSDSGLNNVVPLHITSFFDSGWSVMVANWDTAYPVPDGYILQTTNSFNISPGDTTVLNFVSGKVISDSIFVDPEDPLPNPDSVHVLVWNNHGGNFNGTVDANGVYSVVCDTGSQNLSVWCNGYASMPMNRTIHVTGDTTGGLSFLLNKYHARIYGTLQNVVLPLAPNTMVMFNAGIFTWGVSVDQNTGAYTFDAFDGDWTISPPTLPNRTTPNVAHVTIGEAPDSLHQVNFAYSLVSDVGDPSDDPLPKSFALGQNYPNPFNPTTVIQFALPHRSNVRLTVFNLLGQEITTLVNSELSAGNHTAVWNGRDLAGHEVSSGIYFYRLGADTFCDTKKMVFLK